MTRALYFNRIQQKGLNAMSMLIFLEDRLAENTLIQRPFYLALVFLFPRTTKAEYVALSMAMIDVLQFLNIMGKIKQFLPVSDKNTNFFCTVWEDNQSTIKVAEIPKFTPRTKHIALNYHHFRQFVSNGTLMINPIDTLEQTADIFTKPLYQTKFDYLRKKLCGW